MMKSELIALLVNIPDDGAVYNQWGQDLISVTVDHEGTPEGPGIALNFRGSVLPPRET